MEGSGDGAPAPDTTSQAWHGEGWPEYRASPPWVMAEMVASQPVLVAPILGLPAAREIARLVEGRSRGRGPDRRRRLRY
jgi:hypothetical protein